MKRETERAEVEKCMMNEEEMTDRMTWGCRVYLPSHWWATELLLPIELTTHTLTHRNTHTDFIIHTHKQHHIQHKLHITDTYAHTHTSSLHLWVNVRRSWRQMCSSTLFMKLSSLPHLHFFILMNVTMGVGQNWLPCKAEFRPTGRWTRMTEQFTALWLKKTEEKLKNKISRNFL